MHNIQAVLFDFDDTLQDREAAYRASVSYTHLTLPTNREV